MNGKRDLEKTVYTVCMHECNNIAYILAKLLNNYIKEMHEIRSTD